jgi:hypothetical protein
MGRPRALTGLIASLFVALPASSGTLSNDATALGKIIIYGDSYNNGNEMVDELAEDLGLADSDIWGELGMGGARMGPLSSDTGCVAPYNDLAGECADGIWQIKRVDGACRHFADYGNGELAQPTCAEDIPIQPQDVVVIQFGANDYIRGQANSIATACTGSDSIFQEQKQHWIDALTELEAQGIDDGVIVTSVHIVSSTYRDRAHELDCYNRFLRTELRSRFPKWGFVDAAKLFLGYGETCGLQARADLYANCDAVWGSGSDCVHPSNSAAQTVSCGQTWGTDLIARAIAAQIMEVVGKR